MKQELYDAEQAAKSQKVMALEAKAEEGLKAAKLAEERLEKLSERHEANMREEIARNFGLTTQSGHLGLTDGNPRRAAAATNNKIPRRGMTMDMTKEIILAHVTWRSISQKQHMTRRTRPN